MLFLLRALDRRSESATGRLDCLAAPPGEIVDTAHPRRQDGAGLGVQRLAPAAQQQPDDPCQIDLGIPVSGESLEVVALQAEAPTTAVPVERLPIHVEDGHR